MLVDVGKLMQYRDGVDALPAGTEHITTEEGALLVSEDGSHLVTEG